MLSLGATLELEKELKRLEGLIIEKYKEIEPLTPQEIDYIEEQALISNVGASTRIENAILTNSEIEWVNDVLKKDGKTTAFEEKKSYIINKLSKDKERSIEEVIGCREVLIIIYSQYKELFPLTESKIRNLHNDLLKHYEKAERYRGNYKTSPNNVVSINHETKEQKIVLEPAPPGILTKVAMDDLVTWYNKTITEYPHPILVATEFNFRFLAIHPFQDGNGRLGRALFILALLQSGDKYLQTIVKKLAIDRAIEKRKSEYYLTLHKISGGKFNQNPKKYKLDFLAWYFIKVIEDSLNDIEFYKTKHRNLTQLTEASMQILNCFKSSPEKRIKLAELEKETRLNRRTIQHSLTSLVKKGFLQRLGQKKGSRYQLVF